MRRYFAALDIAIFPAVASRSSNEMLSVYFGLAAADVAMLKSNQ